MKVADILSRVKDGERLNASHALVLLEEASWLDLAQLANEKRIAKVGADKASYTLFKIINYTNVCEIDCTFCSFKKTQGAKGSYVMNLEDIEESGKAAQELGANQIFLQGGVHPSLPFSYYLEALKILKDIGIAHIRGFSPVELRQMAAMEKRPLAEVLKDLKLAGLDSVPGAGAEILVERVREILSPNKCDVGEWGDILKECHKLGLYGSANIVFGSVESNAEMIEHLEVVRNLQDETGGFNSFIPWTFQPQTKDFVVEKIPHHQYLKVLALCRLYLDNIDNIEVSVMVLGQDIGQLALRMGANDISSPVLEENVLRSYGVKDEKAAIKLIEEAGLKAFKRDFNYQPV
ncbi:MAG: CofH family radical SAM protein [SAR324 cluster bacterium]|nr:CofH family radical SAM protein [SAR324 cluster bacterium]